MSTTEQYHTQIQKHQRPTHSDILKIMHSASTSEFSADKIITLDSVRNELIRLEETIIFGLIERSQFKTNPAIYVDGEATLLKNTDKNNHTESFLDFFLEQTEQLHASLGRYTSPDEHPFIADGLTIPLIQAQSYPASLRPNNININNRIKSIYEQKIVPRICQPGTDGQYGSSATMDINVLQCISKRIHFGKFVAEAKFMREKDKYSKLIRERDAEGLMKELTKQAVEDKVVERVTLKAGTYGRDPTSDDTPSYAIPPEEIGQLYREIVMPLNKDVQVLYLLQRLGGPNIAYVEQKFNLNVGEDISIDSSQQAARIFAGIDESDAISSLVGCSDIHRCFAMVKSNNVARCCACIEETPGAISHTTHKLLYDNANGLCITREIFVGNSRYLEISKTTLIPSGDTGNDKTSLTISINDVSGALASVLTIFAERQVNLLLISSSTVGGGRSNFYVEIDGHANEKKVKDTLEAVRNVANYVVCLGSYQIVNR